MLWPNFRRSYFSLTSLGHKEKEGQLHAYTRIARLAGRGKKLIDSFDLISGWSHAWILPRSLIVSQYPSASFPIGGINYRFVVWVGPVETSSDCGWNLIHLESNVVKLSKHRRHIVCSIRQASCWRTAGLNEITAETFYSRLCHLLHQFHHENAAPASAQECDQFDDSKNALNSIPHAPLINGHSTRHRSMAEVGHFRHLCLFVLTFHLPCRNMWFKSSVEIGGTYAGIDDGVDDKNNRDDRKSGQWLPHTIVFCHFRWLIHADQFEKEVS